MYIVHDIVNHQLVTMPQVIQCDAENLTEITSQTCISVIYFDGSWSRKHLHQKNKLLVTLDEKNIDVIYHIVVKFNTKVMLNIYMLDSLNLIM